MMGTIYEINKVYYEADIEGWIIKISLCDENDFLLKDLNDSIKYENKETTDFITLADLFVKIGEYDIAKVYYNKYKDQISNDDDNYRDKTKRAYNGLLELCDI